MYIRNACVFFQEKRHREVPGAYPGVLCLQSWMGRRKFFLGIVEYLLLAVKEDKQRAIATIIFLSLYFFSFSNMMMMMIIEYLWNTSSSYIILRKKKSYWWRREGIWSKVILCFQQLQVFFSCEWLSWLVYGIINQKPAKYVA